MQKKEKCEMALRMNIPVRKTQPDGTVYPAPR